MIPEFTLVVGVDSKHLEQLALTWPTWMRHKPSLRRSPMLVFRDYEQVTEEEVRSVVDHTNLEVYAWPMGGASYTGGLSNSKWTNSQRYKMLAGFEYVPAMFVRTQYFLKIDTDVVAVGNDNWIDESWFENNPAIVSHAWTFTKPPDQILKLDEWASQLPEGTFLSPPLNLAPVEGATRLGHKRIISWCGFFETRFTQICARLCSEYCGMYQLPVPSQDGVMWYVATRLGRTIRRVSMKSRGWEQWSTAHNVRQAVELAMSYPTEP